VLAAQELFEFDDQDLADIDFNEKGKCWINTKDVDIWKDVICMRLLNESILLDTIYAEESKKTKKRIINYHWHDKKIYSKGLFVPKPKERKALIIQMHKDLGNYGEQKTLAEIYKRYFWHNRTEDVKIVVRTC
jgi:hypothetical protein